jgi:3-hydroxyisobutyrate dehydrogenase-like beta-hydroxyacid dehydrogenase
MGEPVIARGQALIGLGNMGAAMAQNIMAAGLPLRGYDLTKRRLRASRPQAGKWAKAHLMRRKAAIWS